MRLHSVASVLLAILLFAGCSGGKEVAEVPQNHGSEISRTDSGAIDSKPMRREFVAMRELVRQHELQQGNDKRIEAVKKALKERFPLLPDEGETEEEKRVFLEAKGLLAKNE